MTTKTMVAVKSGVAAMLCAILAAGAVAQPANPMKQREKLMEENGRDAKAGGQMLKGDAPYDAARAAAIFTNMNKVSMQFGKLFPKGTETGGGTEAGPAIWTRPAEFQAAVAKFQKDTAAAAAAKPATAAEFGPLFANVTGNCRSCHEAFRVKKG